MVHILVEAVSAAPPAVVYELLRDPTTWTAWSSMDEVTPDRPGRDDPYGVGSTRKQTRGRVVGYDEVVELVAGRRFSYVHLRGLPVRDYRADVDLEAAGGGTKIHWAVTFRPKTPGTGWLLRIGVRKFLQETARGLADYASAAVAASDR
ncbi:MAG TPA: SRPBCC family protein [Jatrophihabitantaceae bacterium]|nr:SRPBCC family protein [Jatrophihabitantaceae bacterium]